MTHDHKIHQKLISPSWKIELKAQEYIDEALLIVETRCLSLDVLNWFHLHC